MTVSDAHVLVLDDDPDVAYAAQLLLRRRVRQVDTLLDSGRLERYLQDAAPDVVLLDLNFRPGRTDGAEGMEVLRRLQLLARPPAVIVITAHAQVALAVEAMKRGAVDFIMKPWDNERLVEAVADALARLSTVTAGTPTRMLMGDSTVMRRLRSLIEHIAPTEASVLVLGENGVGKELVARALHDASRRAARPFLAIDMGSLPEATIESELFGHRRGAFTDAQAHRAGRFQAAEGGTLFLDEIGNLPLPSQTKLLTALERREVTPLGADRPQAIDVRIVSATNLDEARLRDAAVFRQDLLYRLNTIVIHVPPLRERRDDIPALLDHFLDRYRQQYARPHAALAPGVLDVLLAHDWPGNVRELRHACERATILAQAAAYTLADFGLAGGVAAASALSTVCVSQAPLRQLGVMEKDAIGAALTQAQGNISMAARLLGLSRAALYRKLDKHGL
jgi:DNA-binding NtrC family response regulator